MSTETNKASLNSADRAVRPADPDLAEQAVSGHGVPSQDPDETAQVSLSPEEAERESKSVLIGGGIVAGMATGAAVGAAVAGPVGVLVGSTLGAVAGVVGSGTAGELAKKKDAGGAADGPKDAQGV